MFAKTYGATTLGIDGRIIDVEVDVSPGLPGFELVGLPDTSVKESKERVRTAGSELGHSAAAGAGDGESCARRCAKGQLRA